MTRIKILSILVAVLFCFSIVSPIFAQYYDSSSGNSGSNNIFGQNDNKSVNENTNVNKEQASTRTLNNAKIKDIWRVNDNGTTVYYATVSDGANEANIKISKNLYNNIANGKVSKENISFSVSGAEQKNINNVYIIEGIKPKVKAEIYGNEIRIYNPDTDKLEVKSTKGLNDTQKKSILNKVNKALKGNIVATVVKNLKNLITKAINNNTYDKVQVKGNNLLIKNKNGKVVKKINVKGLNKEQKKSLAKKYTEKLKGKNKILHKSKIKKEINKIKKEVNRIKKEVNLNNKIQKKYGKDGLRIINKLATESDYSKKTVYNKLKSSNISKSDLKKVYKEMNTLAYNDTDSRYRDYGFVFGSKGHLDKAIKNIKYGKTTKKEPEEKSYGDSYVDYEF